MNTLNVCVFILGLCYSAQTIVFAVGRDLSPARSAGTAIALTNMIVMIGAMILQPMIGRLLDLSLRYHHAGDIPKGIAMNQVHWLYSAADYRLAMSIIPVGIMTAVFLTFFIRETHAKPS
jgi:MFS family permease